MEKAIKQRLLGGLVLIAGAALLLPVLLDGSGSALTVPPMPAPPAVGGVEAMAPRLDEKVAAADQAVDAAHAERTFAPETAPTSPEAAAPQEVAPDAAARAAGEGHTAAAAKPAAAPVKGAEEEAVVAAKPVAEKPPAPAKAEPAKPAAASAAKAPEAKPATAAPLVPGAWVVQVASLSSKDKAEALVQKLRHKNYPAVLHPQGSAWKVVVGPELNREVAESLKSHLASDPELKLNGWVQAYKP